MPADTLTQEPSQKLPAWFKQDLPDLAKIREMKESFRSDRLHTVCESARCPNLGKCWGKGVATFMILGNICTRACRFCAVAAGLPEKVDKDEPCNVALTVKEMNLRYAVITSVARDDLADEGAGHFADVIRQIKELTPLTKVEVLIPDFSGKAELLRIVADAHPEVMSHNIETVRRLSPKVRPQAQYQRSLDVLASLKTLDKTIFTKSSFMLGLGEQEKEIEDVMRDLRSVDCDILTIGQYLAPSKSKRHLKVERFYSPEEFNAFKTMGLSLGFKSVLSAPLVRSSYIAEEGYNECAKTIFSQVR
ncbi:MAG: lipoyl synthase [Candidatus Omnitrophota bacterium]